MSDGADAIQQVNAVANDNGAAHPVLVVNAAVQGAMAARPEAARPAAAPRGRDIMPVAERGRLVEAARPEAARLAVAPRGPPQDRPVHRADERGVAGLHFSAQLGRDNMSFAERGRHADERGVAGLHFSAQLGRDNMSFAERGRHADERGVAGLHFAGQLGRDNMSFAERGRFM